MAAALGSSGLGPLAAPARLSKVSPQPCRHCKTARAYALAGTELESGMGNKHQIVVCNKIQGLERVSMHVFLDPFIYTFTFPRRTLTHVKQSGANQEAFELVLSNCPCWACGHDANIDVPAPI